MIKPTKEQELQFWKDLATSAVDALGVIYDNIHYATCDNDIDAEEVTDALLVDKLGISDYVLDAIVHGEYDVAVARYLNPDEDIDF